MNKKTIYLRIVFFIMMISIMYLIFSFSSQNGEKSGGLSTKVTNAIVSVFEKDSIKQANIVEVVEPILRKIAHFTIYAILGIFTMGFVSTFYDNNDEKNFYKEIAITVLICFLYASSDELHQFFIEERGASFLDVILDTIGSTNGGLIVETTMLILQKYYKYYEKIK